MKISDIFLLSQPNYIDCALLNKFGTQGQFTIINNIPNVKNGQYFFEQMCAMITQEFSIALFHKGKQVFLRDSLMTHNYQRGSELIAAQLFVTIFKNNSPDSSNKKFIVQKNETVAELCKRVQVEFGYTVDIALYYNLKQLDINKKVSEYSIFQGSNIFVFPQKIVINTDLSITPGNIPLNFCCKVDGNTPIAQISTDVLKSLGIWEYGSLRLKAEIINRDFEKEYLELNVFMKLFDYEYVNFDQIDGEFELSASASSNLSKKAMMRMAEMRKLDHLDLKNFNSNK